MKPYVFGVDVGGTTVKLGLFQTDGTLLENWEIPTRTENNGDAILTDIAETIQKKIEEKHLKNAEIQGIGLGVPGPVLEDGTVQKCVNIGWGTKNVKQEMEKLTGFSTKVGNDANVAALGEMWQGGGKGYKNLVMLTLGTGVGGGVIINGQIIPGNDGAAGEIGHLCMNEQESETCGCGNKGCLEQYASATGIVTMTKKYLEECEDAKKASTKLRNQQNLTAKKIFDVAKDGDSIALQMVDEVAKLLGRAMAQIACIVNPQVFVIGGGMAKAGDILMDNIQSYFEQSAFHSARGTKLCLAELENEAGIYGAAKLVLDI